MAARDVDSSGATCGAARSGYTGEDGFEISVPADHAMDLAEALLAADGVEAIGLGARDSLRLEAGLCLHGSDIGPETTPIEAGLLWAIQKVRRPGGARAGGYPGADVIETQIANGAPRKRVGLLPTGRAPMRGGTLLFADENATESIGAVTSGGFGPTQGGPVAMGYVSSDSAEVGTKIFGDVRGKRLPATVSAMPFVPHNYKRK